MHKTVAATLIIALILPLLTLTLTVAQETQPIVGVNTGDWIEYSVKNAGAVPAAQDLTWAKIEILKVEGEAFEANFTVEYVNGTMASAVRSFNFSEGNVQAWIIIPANLSLGQSFHDSSINSNVIIQGQIQKTVAGAERTVTYVNSTQGGEVRNKQWDKATGFYVQSEDNLGTYTVNAQAIATNIWSPQIFGLNQNMFYLIVAAIVVVIAVIAAVAVISRKKKRK